jgi:hypothetical protein
MNKLETEATEIGYSHGHAHANYTVSVSGGDPHAEPEVPARFESVATYFTAAYEEGVQDYLDEAPDGDHLT